jgi:peroxiredoxin
LREAPAKAALDQEFKEKGLRVVSVALEESAEAVRIFKKKFGIKFPLLLDGEGQTPRLFGLWGHPHTVVIDRKGRVVGLVRGERDWQSETGRRLVRQLLEGDR